MTPASATAPCSGVEMTVMSDVSTRSSPSSVVRLLAFGGSANNDVCHAVGVLELVQVERVQRLAEQEQDVVRHVHDVVDGTLTDGSQALDHPIGAGAHLARRG